MTAETPTIVFVHGAWADATGFDAEIRALQREGFRAIGFANPLRDLAGDSTYLAEFLGSLTGSIVLVGHSYGGNVISTAAIGNEQVRALVYLNGWMCDVGESQQQLLDRTGGWVMGLPGLHEVLDVVTPRPSLLSDSGLGRRGARSRRPRASCGRRRPWRCCGRPCRGGRRSRP